MNNKKHEIISVAIDLFAEHGIRDVPIEMIAEKVSLTRSNVYYYFKKGKDELISCIIDIFDSMIVENIKIIMQETGTDANAESILSSLFLAFSEEESGQGRKINRIIFSNYVYEEKINKYLEERFFQSREARFFCIFEMLVSSGKIKAFDMHTAARMLNKIFIASALEDTLSYPFENHEPPQCLDCLKKDCLHIIRKILSGNFD